MVQRALFPLDSTIVQCELRSKSIIRLDGYNIVYAVRIMHGRDGWMMAHIVLYSVLYAVFATTPHCDGM